MPDPRFTRLELFKENMKFSAGHFTIFSATERENLHGHNFTVSVAVTSPVGPDGLAADYAPMKHMLEEMCRGWNETFMLPTGSRHLAVDTSDPSEIRATFAGETLRFLPRDVTLLPVANVTLEELSRLFGERLLDRLQATGRDDIVRLVVRCASGPGQHSSWTWGSP